MTDADVLRCALVEREALPTLFPPTSFRRELDNGLARYLVADSIGVEPQGRHRTGTITERDQTGPPERTTSVDEDVGRTVGFIGIWYMADEAHVVNLGVLAEHRGRGIGELLLISAIEQALERRSTAVTLEVRESNYIARNLYTKYGFSERGRRRAYYSDNREDAVIMTTGVIGDASFLERFRKLAGSHSARMGPSASHIQQPTVDSRPGVPGRRRTR